MCVTCLATPRCDTTYIPSQSLVGYDDAELNLGLGQSHRGKDCFRIQFVLCV